MHAIRRYHESTFELVLIVTAFFWFMIGMAAPAPLVPFAIMQKINWISVTYALCATILWICVPYLLVTAADAIQTKRFDENYY